MNLDRIINRCSFVFGILGLVAIILTGLLGEKRTSFIILGIFVLLFILLWVLWVTRRLFVLSKTIQTQQSSTAIVPKQKSLPYKPFYEAFENEPKLIATKKNKIKIPATFLTWPVFSIVFWVEITEEFFNTHNNRYLFTYTTNRPGASNYPNAFFLGLFRHGEQWKFVIKGEDPSNSNHYELQTGHNLLGWKLFAVRWHVRNRKLDFSIDVEHVFRDQKTIPETHWPKPESDTQFHLGGWNDSWDGGLSRLRFFNFRVFKRYLSDNDLKTILAQEREFVENV